MKCLQGERLRNELCYMDGPALLTYTAEDLANILRSAHLGKVLVSALQSHMRGENYKFYTIVDFRSTQSLRSVNKMVSHMCSSHVCAGPKTLCIHTYL